METKHIIKLSSGKEIELTDTEYNELKSAFNQVIRDPYCSHFDLSPYNSRSRQPPLWIVTSDRTDHLDQINCADNNYGINGLYKNDSLTKEETVNVNRYIKDKQSKNN